MIELIDQDEIGLNDEAIAAAPAPLERALAAVERLEINPLCSKEHAEKLIRRDAAAIVRTLARELTRDQK